MQVLKRMIPRRWHRPQVSSVKLVVAMNRAIYNGAEGRVYAEAVAQLQHHDRQFKRLFKRVAGDNSRFDTLVTVLPTRNPHAFQQIARTRLMAKTGWKLNTRTLPAFQGQQYFAAHGIGDEHGSFYWAVAFFFELADNVAN